MQDICLFLSVRSPHVWCSLRLFLQQCVDHDIANCLLNLHILIIRLNKLGVWLIQEMSGFSPVSNISNCLHSEFIPVNSEMVIALVVISVIPNLITLLVQKGSHFYHELLPLALSVIRSDTVRKQKNRTLKLLAGHRRDRQIRSVAMMAGCSGRPV